MAALVFVVDDMKRVSDLLANALSNLGLEVENFYDAEAALARAIERSPNILITDIEMPGMDGIALAREIHEFSPHCKIVLMSANPRCNPNLSSQVDAEDSFAFIEKPFSFTQLLLLISPMTRG